MLLWEECHHDWADMELNGLRIMITFYFAGQKCKFHYDRKL